MTLDEFSNDPLGEKRMLQNIESLNNALRTEVFDNLMYKQKARAFSKDVGIDAENNKFGKKDSFSKNKRK